MSLCFTSLLSRCAVDIGKVSFAAVSICCNPIIYIEKHRNSIGFFICRILLDGV